MAPHVSFVARAVSAEEDASNPTIIAGIIVAAVIGLGAALWLIIRWFRKRATTKREQLRVSAFVNFTNASDGSMNEKAPSARCVICSRRADRALRPDVCA